MLHSNTTVLHPNTTVLHWQAIGDRAGLRGVLLVEYRDGEGQQKGEVSLIVRQRDCRCGQIAADIEAQIRGLSLPNLEFISKALLDFSKISDLNVWLR